MDRRKGKGQGKPPKGKNSQVQKEEEATRSGMSGNGLAHGYVCLYTMLETCKNQLRKLQQPLVSGAHLHISECYQSGECEYGRWSPSNTQFQVLLRPIRPCEGIVQALLGGGNGVRPKVGTRVAQAQMLLSLSSPVVKVSTILCLTIVLEMVRIGLAYSSCSCATS